MNEHIINLDLEPSQRWDFLNQYKDEMDELLECYLNDFEEAKFIFEIINDYRINFISKEYNEEVEFIATISKFNSDEIMVANLYYDILKFYFGCTAFAVHNNGKIFHARNLDWHTDNNVLSKYTKLFLFQKSGKTIYKTIGWPGFTGVLSGIKPGKFSLTLNAILSNDSPEIAYPISFLLRDILFEENSYDNAKRRLESTKITSDCLILLSGINKSEMAVIERTPNRFESRKAVNSHIIVTNDYKKLENHNISVNDQNILQETSCKRYDRTAELINKNNPQNLEDCLNILNDDDVRMGITVQQMVFDNITGDVKIIKTGCNNSTHVHRASG